MWLRGDSTTRPEGRQAAVIDVGSNSVRLVIYRVDGRALWTVYNEKVVAGLGKDLTGSGRLSPEGMETAIGALRRFRAVLDGWKAEEVMAAATAAVREAADGSPAFAFSISWSMKAKRSDFIVSGENDSVSSRSGRA